MNDELATSLCLWRRSINFKTFVKKKKKRKETGGIISCGVFLFLSFFLFYLPSFNRIVPPKRVKTLSNKEGSAIHRTRQIILLVRLAKSVWWLIINDHSRLHKPIEKNIWTTFAEAIILYSRRTSPLKSMRVRILAITLRSTSYYQKLTNCHLTLID